MSEAWLEVAFDGAKRSWRKIGACVHGHRRHAFATPNPDMGSALADNLTLQTTKDPQQFSPGHLASSVSVCLVR